MGSIFHLLGIAQVKPVLCSHFGRRFNILSHALAPNIIVSSLYYVKAVEDARMFCFGGMAGVSVILCKIGTFKNATLFDDVSRTLCA